MKYLALLALLPACLWATPPSCYPNDGVAAETFPSINIQSGGACVIWHCPSTDGHKWEKISICGTLSEATDQVIATLRTAMSSDKATKDALWTTTFNAPIVPGSIDDTLLATARATPLPTAIPPSGLVTQDISVYKRTPKINAPPVWTKFATIAKGVVCDTTYSLGPLLINGTTQSLGPLYRIDRNDPTFKLDSKVDVLPEVAYGICQ